MNKVRLTLLRRWFCYSLLLFFKSQLLLAYSLPVCSLHVDEPPVTVAEMRYEKLMKAYANKIKQAFSETEDHRSLDILMQFLPEFSHKTDGIKTELQVQLKHLSQPEKEQLLSRIRQRSQTEELIALYFDERITARTAANSSLKKIMEQLHTKSLEVQQASQKYIAAE